jgi:3-oxoadipate enol-lactonase
MHYEISGEGVPVLLLHSLACDHTMFEHQARALARQYRVINVDLPGHGQSRGRAQTPWTLAAITDDLVALLDELGIEAAHWVGLSMGAMLALRAALRHPQRVRRLVLMNGSAEAEEPEKHKLYMSLARTIREGNLSRVLDPLLRIYFVPQTRESQPDLIQRWVAKLSAMNAEGLFEAATAVFNRDDLSVELARIHAPTLVITGEFDQARTPAESRHMVQGIPGARLAVVPGAAHLSALEQPEKCTELILEFLAAR